MTTAANANVEPDLGSASGVLPAIPQRFVSILYDDVHMSMEDAVTARDATTRLFGALAATDRVGIYTTSGQNTLEFTSDHESLKHALNGILPRSAFGRISGVADCPDISYYQADLIENRNDQQALEVATAETVDCAFNGDQSKTAQARAIAGAAAEAYAKLAGGFRALAPRETLPVGSRRCRRASCATCLLFVFPAACVCG